MSEAEQASDRFATGLYNKMQREEPVLGSIREHHDDGTLFKAHQVLLDFGMNGTTAFEIIREMLNRGLVFRETRSD